MAIPSGTKLIIPIRVNGSLIPGNLTHFLYQIDLSAYSALLCNYVDNFLETNIAVYHPATDTTLYKYADVRFMQSDGAILMYFSAPTTAFQSDLFFICAGPDVDEANAPEAFSNSGFTHYWGFDEVSGTSTLAYAGSRTGTVSANASLGNTGKFFKCAANTGVGTGKIAFDNEIFGTGDRSISMLFNFDAFVSGQFARIISNNKFILYVSSATSGIILTSDGTTQSTTASNVLTQNVWKHLVITRTSSGVTNFYINGVLSGTANQSSGTPASGISNMVMLNSVAGDRPFKGSIDEVGFTNNILSTDFMVTRYNQYFNTSFWSYDLPIVITDPKKFYNYKYKIAF